MPGIFPDNGVSSASATNAYVPTQTTPTCTPAFYSNDCNQRLDIDQLNALISENLALWDEAKITGDCSKLNNNVTAIKALIDSSLCDNLVRVGSGLPTTDNVTSTTTVVNADGSTTTCTVNEPFTPCPPFFYDSQTGDIYVYADGNWRAVSSSSSAQFSFPSQAIVLDEEKELTTGTVAFAEPSADYSTDGTSITVMRKGQYSISGFVRAVGTWQTEMASLQYAGVVKNDAALLAGNTFYKDRTFVNTRPNNLVTFPVASKLFNLDVGDEISLKVHFENSPAAGSLQNVSCSATLDIIKIRNTI